MEHNNPKEKQVIVDIEVGEAPVSGKKWGKKSLNKLVSGVLGFNGLPDDEKNDSETTKLLPDECDQGNVEKKKGKIKKAPKPPRPPKGPLLDASDMRLIREISKIATKKRERNERIKALKKMKADEMNSPASPSSSSSSLPSSSSSLSSSSSSSLLSMSGRTISAMIITVLFLLLLLFQGLRSSSSPNTRLAGQGANNTDVRPSFMG